MPKSRIPSVVLLGKQSENIDNDNIKSIISSIDPNGVPYDFIHKVNLIDTNGNKYSLPKAMYKNGIVYKNIDQYFNKVSPSINFETIEIVIDLLKVNEQLDSHMTKIFNSLKD